MKIYRSLNIKERETVFIDLIDSIYRENFLISLNNLSNFARGKP